MSICIGVDEISSMLDYLKDKLVTDSLSSFEKLLLSEVFLKIKLNEDISTNMIDTKSL